MLSGLPLKRHFSHFQFKKETSRHFIFSFQLHHTYKVNRGENQRLKKNIICSFRALHFVRPKAD